ncbi:glutamate--cysteine ligase [Flocculibacter collagenilyticus]|uniref:glutamate--cysteine ligase n=1 Tax=Flocculibacter collagenilyticus TaxID=2744479 RepID=UPI0018F55EC3|nr:glutamate--cysteine ligase [Flocculibacter collagenilyticus]
MKTELKQNLTFLSHAENVSVLNGIGRGIERETLRIIDSGSLAQSPHSSKLGSALTNKYITTDYSESLLEFITPVSYSIDDTLDQLKDIHKFTIDNIGDEYLWPVSMPCFISNEDDIALANYGTSNIGRMKTTYRQGLKNRYGSMMQAIAGVHFNFSMPESFWASLYTKQNEGANSEAISLQDFISKRYLAGIRNFKRQVWLISYLFGASPALCSSFLQQEPKNIKFEKLANGTIYLPYATSLRMSDLGYTNHAQASLNVSYNNIEEYVKGLRAAINTPSEEYANIGTYENGVYKQLNANVLQIENEFYSPIRPKRNGKSGEKPTDALEDRGIEYIEVRALDINPFSDVGISKEQIQFLDVFLLYCILLDSPSMDAQEQEYAQQNLNKVVNEGRKPELYLNRNGKSVLKEDWANEIFEDLRDVAELLDNAYDTQDYSDVISKMATWVKQPELTFSGQLMKYLIDNNIDNGCYALDLAKKYQTTLTSNGYRFFSEEQLQQEATRSLQAQQAIEQADSISFDTFLQQYFAR